MANRVLVLLGIFTFLTSTSIFAQTTGELRFTTSSGGDVLNYTAAEDVWVEVVDADRSTEVVVTVSSPTEPGGEQLTLAETGTGSGVFRGSIATAEATASADGVLQVARGEQLTVSYVDPSDDFGNERTISETAFYGVTLVSGTYSANMTWRKADSPYLVTGDVTVSQGARLTIEPGVEVRFMPTQDDQNSGQDANRSELYIRGQLIAEGTEADSIRFTSNGSSPSSGDWYGVYMTDTGSNHVISYARIEHATYGIYWESDHGSESISASIGNNVFTELGTGVHVRYVNHTVEISGNRFNNIGGRSIYYYGNRDRGFVTIDRNEVNGYSILVYSVNKAVLLGNNSDNVVYGGGTGLELNDINDLTVQDHRITNMGTAISVNQVNRALIRSNELVGNNQGLYLERTTALVDSNLVSDNSQDGIYVNTNFENPTTDTLRYNTITNNNGNGVVNNGYARTVANYNNIYGNGQYDFRNNSLQWEELDGRYNWWGDNTTAVMNTGGNPKNIDKIYDRYDDNGLGFVNYGGWLDMQDGTPSGVTTTGELRFTTSSGGDVLNYTAAEDVWVEVVDADRSTEVVVTVSSPTEPGGEQLTLAETGTGSGVFRGSIATAEATASADGVLQVARGEQLTVSYVDPSDDFGNERTISETAFYGVTLVSGTYSANMTWRKADSPYLVTGDVTVSQGARLTIEPGVEVRFMPTQDDQNSGQDANRSELYIRGQLIAEGTEADSIRFTSNGSSPSSGDWYGVYMTDTGSNHVISYARIEHATYGIYWESDHGSESISASIGNNVFTELGTGVHVRYVNHTVEISGNRFNNIGGRSIYYYGNRDRGFVTIDRNEVNGYSILVYSVNKAVLLGNNSDNVVYGGGTGLELNDINDLTVQDHRITNMGTAISVNQVNRALIRSNELVGNNQGLYLERTTALVDSNLVSDNSQDGIYVNTNFENPTTDTLRYNTITNNNGNGVVNNGYARTVANYNNIYGNGQYDFRNNSLQWEELDGRYNWWGDNTTAVMNTGGNPKNIDKIYDRYDDNGLGFVNYGGWLDGEVDNQTNIGTDGVLLEMPEITGILNDTVYTNITLSGLSSSEIQSFEFTVSYDTTIVNLLIPDQQSSLISSFTVQKNETTPGVVNISGYATSSGISTNGDFANMQIILKTGGVSSLNISGILFNEGEPSVSGKNGSVTVNDYICGDVTGDFTITALDASYILRHTVFLAPQYPLTGTDSTAADVTGNGDISAFDAYQILRHNVGLDADITCQPKAQKQVPVIASTNWQKVESEDPNLVKYGLNIDVESGDLNAVELKLPKLDGLEFKGIKSASDGWTSTANENQDNMHFALVGLESFTSGKLLELEFSRIEDANQSGILGGILTFNEASTQEIERLNINDKPTVFELSQNYPNPFNPSTKIKYSLPENTKVKLTVYNLLGQKIVELVNSVQTAGSYTVNWDAGNQASGMYIYQLKAGNSIVNKKMTLIK